MYNDSKAQIEYNINPGYYYNTKQDTGRWPEILWFQVTPQFEVRHFYTASYEYCLTYMFFSADPKTDYKILVENQDELKYIIDNDCDNQFKYLESRLIDTQLMTISPPVGKNNAPDTLFFFKDYLIHKYLDFDSIEFKTDTYKKIK